MFNPRPPLFFFKKREKNKGKFDAHWVFDGPVLQIPHFFIFLHVHKNNHLIFKT